MVDEVLASLNCKSGGTYVDGTVGGAGHAYEILAKSAPDGLLIGIDCDAEALGAAAERLRSFGSRSILVKGDYADIAGILAGLEVKRVDGIIFDLGVSSHQLETASRGFSFTREAPLDMRMDCGLGYTAYDLVNKAAERELENIIRDYGEEKMARRIARAIVKKRAIAPIATTTELAALVARTVPFTQGRRAVHPATRTFQAIRIAVNNELERLPEAIKAGIEVLTGGGRFSIISFHSLEDRIVKNEFRRWERDCLCPPKMPVCTCQQKALIRVVTKKPLRPGPAEVAANPRARSASLRTAERI